MEYPKDPMQVLNSKLFSKRKNIPSVAQFNQNSLNCIYLPVSETHMIQIPPYIGTRKVG